MFKDNMDDVTKQCSGARIVSSKCVLWADTCNAVAATDGGDAPLYQFVVEKTAGDGTKYQDLWKQKYISFSYGWEQGIDKALGDNKYQNEVFLFQAFKDTFARVAPYHTYKTSVYKQAECWSQSF